MGTETFAQRFERYLVREVEAGHLVDKVIRLGFQRDAIVGMVGEATDPILRKQLSGTYHKVRGEVLSRKRRAALSKRLRTAAEKLEASFGNPFVRLHPASERFVTLAQTLNHEAAALDQFPVPRIGKVFADKVFGRHLLRVGICVRLDAPETVSFDDIERLLWFGADARGLRQKPYGGSRSLEREYKWFTKTTQWRIWLYINKYLRWAYLSRTSLWQ